MVISIKNSTFAIEMDTKRNIYEIEVALAKCDQFNFVRNIVAFNVKGQSEKLPIYHECDMLVMSKSGYLTEIEIKRSWSDFLADFKKHHGHKCPELIKQFYYCVPLSIYDKVYDKLKEKRVDYTGIITYNEDLYLEFHRRDWQFAQDERPPFVWARKLFLEQQLELARLGAMRSVLLREKLSKIENN